VTGRRRYCLRGHDTDAGGRDSSGRCLICKREAMWAARAPAREAAAAARAARAVAGEAEFERLERERIEEPRRRQAEADRRREQEYQRAIKAGGRAAAEAKWWRASDETAMAGRYDLCQWEDEIDGEYTHVCFNRTRSDVYCSMHNRQLEREIERKRKAKERESEHAGPERTTPSAPRARRRPAKRSTSNWLAYKTKHPERARFYASSTWRSMRDRQLKANPTCVVCGERAGHADHVLSIALGGSKDGQLQSMCTKHHHEKTVRDSHAAARWADQRRHEKNRAT
jgi:hypothetical protein